MCYADCAALIPALPEALLSKGTLVSNLIGAYPDSYLAEADRSSDVVWLLFQQACNSELVLSQLAQGRLWASQSGDSCCQCQPSKISVEVFITVMAVINQSSWAALMALTCIRTLLCCLTASLSCFWLHHGGQLRCTQACLVHALLSAQRTDMAAQS